MAAARLTGRANTRDRKQVTREPLMNMAAPTWPPPSMVSLGFHWAENRNSVILWPKSQKVPLPFTRRKAAIRKGSRAAAMPQAVMTVCDKDSLR